MKSTTINVLLSLAIAMMVMATDSPGDPTSAAVTVTVTEQVCMTGKAGDATPLSMANALATAADESAAASLIASMMADVHDRDTIPPHSAAGTTTVTTVANATDCPAQPTFDLSPVGLIQNLLSDEPNRTTTTTTTDTGLPPAQQQHWSQGRNSLCFTNSDSVGTGRYGIYLDGWGQEADGCGKGALDNLRGHCGWIMWWECRHWGTGVLLTFTVSGAKYVKCVLDAMWAASPKDKREVGLCCVYVGPSLIHFNNC
jgi:hypothetical protein